MAASYIELHVLLERFVALAKSLEAECADSADARITFEALKREIDAIRKKLKVLNFP
jgi:hypothetical protein